MLTSAVDRLQGANKENASFGPQISYKAVVVLEQRVETLERKLTHFEQMKENTQSDNCKCNYQDKTEKLATLRELKDLEFKIENSLKNQAKEIAADVSELERIVKQIQSKSINNSDPSDDKLELKLFENYILERVDASLRDITKTLNQSKCMDTDSKIQFLIEPSISNDLKNSSSIQPNNRPLRIRNDKSTSLNRERNASIESEIRTCKPNEKQISIIEQITKCKEKYSYMNDLESSSELKSYNVDRSKEIGKSINPADSKFQAERPPVWNLKESATKKNPRSGVDIMK